MLKGGALGEADGPASVQVRSVGGDELWDYFIDLIPAVLYDGALGGADGPASVQVRSVGGGELWDDFIDLIPALSNNETIAGVLSGRDIKHRAISGIDYIQLDTTLNFAVRSSFPASQLVHSC